MKRVMEMLSNRKLKSSHLESVVSDERKKLKTATIDLKHGAKAFTLIQNVAEAIQHKTYQDLASIVTKCLKGVYKNPYKFCLKFEKKKGKTDAVFTFERDGMVIDPKKCGGMSDVASLALRIAAILLTKPAKRRLIVKDEPFRCVARSNIKKIPKLLEILSQELGVQFIMATHEEELQIGNIVNLEELK
jgi:ABC-type branched-subunit amino acid transport system ATPase component